MKFHALRIPGVWLLEPEPFVDERGAFYRHFCQEEFARHGLPPLVAQGNVSLNPHRHTLRGFHFQLPPHEEAKTLTCFRGSLHDIVVDLRPDSPTFRDWLAVELSAAEGKSLHLPPGCANAFLTLEPDTLVHYYMAQPFHPGAYTGFRFDDPAFRFEWPAQPLHVSDKDRSFPDLDLGSLIPRKG